jgi:hypothetical protein
MLFPLLLGWLGASALGVPPLPALFICATLTATSIGVTAAVLEELGASSSRVATLILGAAVVDDVLGLVLLSALVGISSAQNAVGVEIGVSVVQAVGFLAAALWLGRPLTQATLWLTRWTQSRSTLLVLVFSTLLLTAGAAKIAGLEMIIGAYAAGLALARHPERDWLETELEPLIELFTPIFFVLVGSAIALETFAVHTPAGRSTLALAGLLFVAAVAGKLLAPLSCPRRRGSDSDSKRGVRASGSSSGNASTRSVSVLDLRRPRRRRCRHLGESSEEYARARAGAASGLQFDLERPVRIHGARRGAPAGGRADRARNRLPAPLSQLPASLGHLDRDGDAPIRVDRRRLAPLAAGLRSDRFFTGRSADEPSGLPVGASWSRCS